MKRPSGEHTPLGTVPTVFESPSVGPPKNPGILFLTYQQINAVLAAFVFIQFLSHFVTFDWRGPLAELAAAWDLYVHPVVQWLFEISLVALVKLIFKFDIIIPPILIDYTSVGLVYYISIIRAKLSRPRIGFRRRDSTRWKRFLVLANPAHIVKTVFLWPVEIGTEFIRLNHSLKARKMNLVPVGYVLGDYSEPTDQDRVWHRVEILSPLFYLVIIWAANYLLIRP